MSCLDIEGKVFEKAMRVVVGIVGEGFDRKVGVQRKK